MRSKRFVGTFVVMAVGCLLASCSTRSTCESSTAATAASEVARTERTCGWNRAPWAVNAMLPVPRPNSRVTNGWTRLIAKVCGPPGSTAT